MAKNTVKSLIPEILETLNDFLKNQCGKNKREAYETAENILRLFFDELGGITFYIKDDQPCDSLNKHLLHFQKRLNEISGNSEISDLIIELLVKFIPKKQNAYIPKSDYLNHLRFKVGVIECHKRNVPLDYISAVSGRSSSYIYAIIRKEFGSIKNNAKSDL